MAAPSFTDILQDRTHKYRRTLIGICIVLTVIYSLPNLDFSGLSLFGIKPTGADQDARRLVLSALWIIWLYHFFLFAYYATRDWRDWRFELRNTESFPAIRMYFWKEPTEEITKEQYGHLALEEWSWKYLQTRLRAQWACDYTSKSRGTQRAIPFSVPTDAAKSVRSRICWFVIVDCGLPALLSMLALVAAIVDWWR
jgi:hypothetical protein